MSNATENDRIEINLFDGPNGDEIRDMWQEFSADQRADLLWHVEQAAHFKASQLRHSEHPHASWCERHPYEDDTCATAPYSYNRDPEQDEPFTAYLLKCSCGTCQGPDDETRIHLEEHGTGEYRIERIERLAKHLLHLVELARESA